MNFLPDDRAAELRELFFESAQELLQALNEAGLELEKHPADEECLRGVRRTVHTLKGDSAACGYHALSELAHELEDVLTTELVRQAGGALAEVVLSAADTFHAMLAAYRDNLQPPSGEELRAHIRRLIQKPEQTRSTASAEAHFDWTEYERLLIAEAASRGLAVYNIALMMNPEALLPAAALQLVRNVLHSSGTVLALHPEDGTPAEHVGVVQAALASAQPQDWIADRCRIPHVVTSAIVEKIRSEEVVEVEEDALQSLLGAEAASGARANRPVTTAPEKRAAAERSSGTGAGKSAASGSAENVLRVDASRIDAVINLVGELIIGKSMLHRAISEFDSRFPKDPLRNKFAEMSGFQSRVLDELQKSVMKIRMVPVEQLFRRYPRIVRDVAKLLGKDVALELAGQNTDMDKGILDALAEPLSHVVRNAVDHGIEPPEQRIAAGKRARGTIRMNAYHQGNHVILEVSDDGRGLEREKIVARAIERGVISAETAGQLSESEAFNLIFESGLTTAEAVSEISGRGVGLDVVRTVLERIKATLTIESKPGKGTTFLICVPLTLASIQALLFRIGGRLYALPLAAVTEITRAGNEEIHRVEGREVLQLRDKILTLMRLDQLVRGAPAATGKRQLVIVVGEADRRFGLVVDSVAGEEELVVKALDEQTVGNGLASGASILGDGTVVLILDIAALMGMLSRVPVLEATA